jgi:hypothetical protein
MILLIVYIILCLVFAYLYTWFLVRPFLEIFGHGRVLNKEERAESRKKEKEYRQFKRQQRKEPRQ